MYNKQNRNVFVFIQKEIANTQKYTIHNNIGLPDSWLSIYSLHRSFNCYVNQNPGHKHNPLEIPEIEKERNLISNEIGNGFRLPK